MEIKSINGNKTIPIKKAIDSSQSQRTDFLKIFHKIGTITKDNPTVSDVFIDNPAYKKDCWNLIHKDLNKNKEYKNILPGSSVYLNAKTSEITWLKDEGNIKKKSDSSILQKNKPYSDYRSDELSERLVKAVEQYMGVSYKDINCYGLVVRGLKNLGIRYDGNGGLKEQLVKMALDEGRNENAYLNGEGIIASSGIDVYSKSLSNISDPESQTRAIFKEIEPILKKGQILSFSTKTRGHTGVISKKNNQWTYINSGRIDHSVNDNYRKKGVGEEDLFQEIKNWFVLASKKHQHLQISIGELQKNRLTAFLDNKKDKEKIG